MFEVLLFLSTLIHPSLGANTSLVLRLINVALETAVGRRCTAG